jgi:hypothetical protein
MIGCTYIDGSRVIFGGEAMLSEFERLAMEAVNRDNLLAVVSKVATYERLSGSADEWEAFKFIEDKMRSYGFQTSLTKHDAYISLPVSASMKVVYPEEVGMYCTTHSSSAGTPLGGVEGEAVWVGDLRQEASRQIDVRGKFAVIEGLASPDPTAWAMERGALGQIHVSSDEHIHDMTIQNIWGNPDDKNVSMLPSTHVVSISRSDGDKLRAFLSRGPVRVHVETAVETKWTKIPLLECRLDGNDGTGDFLLLSGHVDSWYYGAMDNGSANATMMEVARVLASARNGLRRGLTVCFWSGHSHGRYAGSAWYCDNHWHELNRHCIMHLNVDSTGGIGATNLRRANVMAETRNVAAWAIDETLGIPFEGSRMARNGDQSFWGIGIPSMFVSIAQQPEGGLGWWWHNPADLPDKIDPDNLVRDTKVYALVAARFVSQPILPFDYSATSREWQEKLRQLQHQVGDKFDLSLALDRCSELSRLLDELAVKRASSEVPADVVNNCLVELGRILIPVAYTRAGRFGQDPAFNVPLLPDLQDVCRLIDYPAESDESRFLKVRLTRGLNRVIDALDRATHEVSGALGHLH